MSFESLRESRRNLGARLIGGYTLLLLATVGLLYLLVYWHMHGALLERDRDMIRTELFEMVHAYGEVGLDAMREEAREIAAQEAHPPISIWVHDVDGRMLFEEWQPSWAAPLGRAYEVLPVSDEVRWTFKTIDRDHRLDVAAFHLPDGRLLNVAASAEPRGAILAQFQRTFILTAAPMFLLALLGGVWLARRILRPVRDLAAAATKVIETGDVKDRVRLRDRGDELDALAVLFNRMLDRIGRLLTGMSETLDNVAHDLRTPLTRLRGRAEVVLQEETPSVEALREALSTCLEASDQAVTILDSIMEQAEAEAGTLPLHREPVSLRSLVDGVADLYALVAEEHGIGLDVTGSTAVMARVDHGRMSQVVANLMDNALKFTPPGGDVVASVESGEGEAVIRVRDSGVGISRSELPRIWDRLYRGDRSRSTRGLGLGLSLVSAIVRAHGGTVSATSVPDEGSEFVVRLPAEP